MKMLLFLALPAMAWCGSPYTWGTKLRLNNGVDEIKLIHTVDGIPQDFTVAVPLPLGGAAYQKITIWPVHYRSFTTETTCANPCELNLPLHYGSAKLRAEYFDGANTLLRTIEWQSLPQAQPPCEASYTMPLEIVGFAPYRRCAQVQVPESAILTGTIRLYVYCHRCTYDGKARVRVNGTAWRSIRKANVSLLNQFAGTTYQTLDFGQSLLEFYVDLPANSVRAGANDVEWEYSRERKEQSGYRVLRFGLFRPDVAISTISISGNLVSATTSTAHGFQSGNDVRINQFNGVAWRVNGLQKNIAVTSSTSFTFTLNGVGGKRDGTWNYAGVSVARALNDFDAFAEENPASWTAPAGSNAANGQTAFAANTLLAPGMPGKTITASCNDCHANGGRDLKYFNYSNWSNIVRSQFHGMTEQQSKDIAAYIRSHSTIAPGRPYIPPYQPAPCANTVDPQAWSGCATLEDILPFDYGMYEELFGSSPDPADFSPDRTDVSFRATRISMQLPDWNDWLPAIHPKDYWNTASLQTQRPGGHFSTSDLKSAYESLRQRYSGFCPGTGCAARIVESKQIWLSEVWEKFKAGLMLGADTACASDRPGAGCFSTPATEENQRAIAIYSTGLWNMVKLWELAHEFDLERHGAVWFPAAGVDRMLPTTMAFGASTDLSKARQPATGLIPGIFDSSSAAEVTNGIGWYHQQGLWLSSRGSPGGYDSIQPLDVPYMYGKFKGLYANAKLPVPLLQSHLLMVNFRRYRSNYPNYAGPSESWWASAVRPSVLIANDHELLWAGVPSEDRYTVRRQVLEAATQKMTNLWCGVEQNGSAPLFTPAMWHVRQGPSAYASANGALDAENLPNVGWGLMLYGGGVGLSQGLKDQLASCFSSIWTGPNSTLSGSISAAQSTIPLGNGASFPDQELQVVIGSERIACSGRSGNTLTGCARGDDGTTAATHSNGETVQHRIRWDRARVNSTCTLQADGLRFNGTACYAVKP